MPPLVYPILLLKVMLSFVVACVLVVNVCDVCAVCELWVYDYIYYFEVHIALIFCRVWSEHSASFFSGFSLRLLCFVEAKTLCRYGCMYFLAALVLVCVDVIVMSSA